MLAEDFFSSIQSHYNNEQPFVVYCKPNSEEVVSLLQKDNELYKITDFSENGFIFSPFDIRKDTILIPFSRSQTTKLDYQLVEHDDIESQVLRSHSDKEKHIALITKAIDGIKNETYQKIVVSRIHTLTLKSFELITIVKRLLNFYNSAFTYCWYHPQVGLWLGATPERLLKTENETFSSMALAGTKTFEGSLDVNWNQKEIKEQQFVTDYQINQLKEHLDNMEVSEPHTIRANNVLHLKTEISGKLKSKSIKQLIHVLHPTPAVCGLPKTDAMQFILDHEDYNREFYTGFLGEINFESEQDDFRNSDLYANLRCTQIKGNQALVYVGGGITEESKVDLEWQETISKTKTIRELFG
jgi:isochorismate synthase